MQAKPLRYTVQWSFKILYHHHWQNCPFRAMTFRRRFCQIASGFRFFGFRNNNFSTEQGRKPCIQPRTWRTWSLHSCPPSERVAQLYPPIPGSLFFVFYDSQGCDGGILTSLHTGQYYCIQLFNHLFSFKYILSHINKFINLFIYFDFFVYIRSRGSSVGIATGYWTAEKSGSDSRQGQENFPFFTASMPALGLTKRALSWG
jgi:hypothetical protein